MKLSDLGVTPVSVTSTSGYASSLHDPSWYTPSPVITATKSSINPKWLNADYELAFDPSPFRAILPAKPNYIQTTMNLMPRRLVTVVISDPKQKDIDKAVLFYDTLTVEGSDEDVFHEIGVSDILDKYNFELMESHVPVAGQPDEPRQVRMSELKKQIITIAHL